MAKGEKTIRRTLHFKFTLSGASESMIAMIKSAAPMYQMFGEAKVRLLQNVDDPNRFLQEIEYVYRAGRPWRSEPAGRSPAPAGCRPTRRAGAPCSRAPSRSKSTR